MRSRWLADATRNALAGRRSLSQPRPAASLHAPCWFAPPSPWVKLNCDGAHRAGDGSSCCRRGFETLRVNGCMVFLSSLVVVRLWRPNFEESR
ncbi:hypothetical protein V6N13_014965 [Hibiscus sabdariffa]